jgi:hypothetical protein
MVFFISTKIFNIYFFSAQPALCLIPTTLKRSLVYFIICFHHFKNKFLLTLFILFKSLSVFTFILSKICLPYYYFLIF